MAANFKQKRKRTSSIYHYFIKSNVKRLIGSKTLHKLLIEEITLYHKTKSKEIHYQYYLYLTFIIERKITLSQTRQKFQIPTKDIRREEKRTSCLQNILRGTGNAKTIRTKIIDEIQHSFFSLCLIFIS